MERLLVVLNKIEEQLEQLEPKKDIKYVREVVDKDAEIKDIEPAPEVTVGYGDPNDETTDESEEIRNSGNQAYINHEKKLRDYNRAPRGSYQSPQVEQGQKTPPRLYENGVQIHNLWTEFLGYAWSIPRDGRVVLTFQEHQLSGLEDRFLLPRLNALKQWSSVMGSRCFRIYDYDKNGRSIEYRLPAYHESKNTVLYHQVSLEERIMKHKNDFWVSTFLTVIQSRMGKKSRHGPLLGIGEDTCEFSRSPYTRCGFYP